MKPFIKYFFILFILNSSSLSGQMGFGESSKINTAWKFSLEDSHTFKHKSYDDSQWKNVSLPHDWSVRQPLDSTLASATGYLPGGVAWYRKNITVPKSKKGQKVYLYFEGIYNKSTVYVNGKKVGYRPNGYISFSYDITSYLNFGKNNIIAVRVDHSKSADSRWYTGSGIYRDAWLVYAHPTHFAQWGVYAVPEINAQHGTLKLLSTIENQSSSLKQLTLKQELFDSKGNFVAVKTQSFEINSNSSHTIESTITLESPELWTLENPTLYTLKSTLLSSSKVIDESNIQTGFRTLNFDPNKGFALNGEWMKIKGVCLHHDLGVLGSKFYPDIWELRLKTLKSIGVNAVRTSHNPQAPGFYKLCDEIGLLVLNEAYDEWEFPKRKWIKGWNVGKPGYQGSFDYFEEWGEKDLEDFVKRDRNHPSIFAWSIGNEVDYPNDPYSHPILDGKTETGFSQPIFGGYKKEAPNAIRLGAIAKRLVAVVKKHDQSRPTTAGLAGVAMSNATEYPGALDITGYNYTESKYLSDHQAYPNRVIFGSENRQDYKAWLAVKNNAHIFGQFLWTGMDYLGESKSWPSRGFYTGLINFIGEKKPRGYFRQSLWSDSPMIYVGTIPAKSKRKYTIDAWPVWSYEEGENIRVMCYTNAPFASLKLNGKTVGEIAKHNNETGIISWEIPYQKGTLTAVGLDDSYNEISRFNISTPKSAFALSAENTKIALDPTTEVVQLNIKIVDEEGNLVFPANNEIQCEILGSAELLGLEAANNRDMGDYTDQIHRAYHGQISAFVKILNPEEEVTVKFYSPNLKPCEVHINPFLEN